MLPVRTFAVSVLLVVSSALAICGSAFAAAGDIDTTFGLAGFTNATPEAGVISESSASHAILPDGRIVVAGTADTNPGPVGKVAVRLFSSEGSLDSSFAGDGLAIIDSPAGMTLLQVTGVGVQQDGAIVVGARYYLTADPNEGTMAVIRLTSAGALDASFDADVNANGIYLPEIAPNLPPTPSETERAILVQPDDKIVISGLSYYPPSLDTEQSIMRLEADGTPDSSFSSNGRFTFNPNSSPEDARALARIPGAGYVMGGRVRRSTGPTITEPTLSRITESGAIDPSFTGGAENLSTVPGVVTTQWGTDPAGADFGEITDVKALADGRLIAVGYSEDNDVSNFAGIARYTANGALDPTFGTNGRTLLKINGQAATLDFVTVQSDGKYLATGHNFGINHGVVVRFNTNGSLDQTFGVGGVVTIEPSAGSSAARTIQLQAGERPVVVVSRGVAAPFTLARLLADPAATPPSQPPTLVPLAAIKSPSRSSMRAKSLKRIQGTAGPAGSVAKVEIAIRKVDRAQLKKKRCLWLTNARGTLKRVKAKNRACKSPRWIKASGTTAWSFKLRRTLKRGSYQLSVRTTLTTGERHTTFTKAQGNFFAFKLR